MAKKINKEVTTTKEETTMTTTDTTITTATATAEDKKAMGASYSRLAAFNTATKTTKASAKKAAKDSKELEKISTAKLDDNGQMTITILYENDGPMAYVLSNQYKKVRLSAKFAYGLIDSGKAVKLAPEDFETLLKDHKAEVKKTKAAEKAKAKKTDA